MQYIDTPLCEQFQELSLYRSFTLRRENIVTVIIQDRLIDDNLKRQIKNRTLYTSRLFLITKFFNILAIYPPSLFNIHRVTIFLNFSR